MHYKVPLELTQRNINAKTIIKKSTLTFLPEVHEIFIKHKNFRSLGLQIVATNCEIHNKQHVELN